MWGRVQTTVRSELSLLFRYGDISPITPVGRIVACFCALCGAAMIGMLVSVLVDRYQRVFARKLYIKEEIIDFDDYSDEENDDADSKGDGSGQLRRRNNGKEIEDPDARAKINASFEDTDTPEVTATPDAQVIDQIPISRKSSRVHFIIGYVDDEKHQTSSNLLETISSLIAQKQTVDDNIRLSIVSADQQLPSVPHDVQFEVALSSGEDSEDDEELTEIGPGRAGKGNVLKTFLCPPSPQERKNSNKSEKRV